MTNLFHVTLAIVSVATCPLWAQGPDASPTPSASPTGGLDEAPKQERAGGAQTPASQPAAQAPRPKGLQWKIDEYTVKLGGYVKVDVIHDFDEIGSTDNFDPRTIPTNDEVNPGTNSRIHARATRLNLDVSGPTDVGDMRLFIEGDFFSPNNGFRLRHAYGRIGPVLGGQTWSTFMDEDAMPETLDYESPIAFPLIRQAQIRYIGDIGNEGSYWAVALEDPASTQIPTGVPGEVEEETFDLTGRLRLNFDRGHFQAGVFLGTASYDVAGASAQDTILWGINLSTKIQVFDSDEVFVQATYGDGVGRYRGGVTAGLDASGNLEPVTIRAGMLAYQHHWSEKWRSTVTYSLGEGDAPSGSPGNTIEGLDYFAVNLIWQFCNRAWAGVELLHGSVEDANNNSGEANRMQVSIRFDI
jgi:hypothetical protein